ncbi:hypothetical protein GGI07_003537 [Coemansia sp. Benny D115]|nr:hypothetical protein GGI07_003537 [Coemansia sp. Benny D115]
MESASRLSKGIDEAGAPADVCSNCSVGDEQLQPFAASVHQEAAGSEQALKERNDRALLFLTSIKTSNTVETGPRAGWGMADNSGPQFDFDPERILESRNHSSIVRSGMPVDSPHSSPANHRMRAGGGRESNLVDIGGSVAGNSADMAGGIGSGQPDFGYPRRLSYTQGDYTDGRNGHFQSEFVLMKPSSLPMVYASIKPFTGKGEDSRHHRYIVSSVTDGPEIEYESNGAANTTYQPNRLDDPGLHKGLQRTVLGLTGYMSTIFEYTRPDDLRQELNDHFRETHPELYAAGLTLDQIRRLRAHMLRVTREQDLELSTAALGWVYFEKLIWKGYVVKDNRKLVAALKINESREVPISRSLQAIQRRFEVSSKAVLDKEFSVFAELDFCLWVPRREFMPHFLRMFEVLGLYRTLADYLGESDFFAFRH